MEEEIKAKVPEVHSSIIRMAEEEVDWKEIHFELSNINWLVSDPVKDSESIISFWNIVDRYAVSVIEGKPRFRLIKINRIKLFGTEITYGLINNKDRVKTICTDSRLTLDNLLFFRKASNLLHASVEHSDFTSLVESIESTYREMKHSYALIFMHLDKFLLMEYKNNLSDLLDDKFNQQVIAPLKSKLEEDPDTRVFVQTYDKVYSPQYTMYSTCTSSYPRDNFYFGEMDENRKRSGYGKITYANGDAYEGFWEKDKPSGQGLYIWKEYGVYEGEFFEGTMTGTGRRVYASGNVYCGDFVRNKKHGKGQISFKNGDSYEGEWDNDEMHGLGKYTWSTEDTYIGQFQHDKRTGKGSLTTINGEVFVREWKDGAMQEPPSI